MTRAIDLLILCALASLLFACGNGAEVREAATTKEAMEMNSNTNQTPQTFGANVEFLEKHTQVIVLGDADSAQIVVAPEWQGRVMDSTVAGSAGQSHGWLNYKLIAQGLQPESERGGLQKHIHAWGGEDRFWIGPEGGQYSWFFAEGTDFTFEQWKVPAFIDTKPWRIVEQTEHALRLQHREQLTNWSGNRFDMTIQREVAVLDEADIEAAIAVTAQESDKVTIVAYESRNRLINSGAAAWTEDNGLPSIWILSMLQHGDKTRAVVPLQSGDGLGYWVKDDYFGKVPAERLIIDKFNSVAYFTVDGRYRSKIGVSPQRSRGVVGSWDVERGVLTIVQYNVPDSPQTAAAPLPYVNSAWEEQARPYRGDAINLYNDGAVAGDILGPFYEIETSSPALALQPDAGYTHIQRTIHIEGDRHIIDTIARRVFGVGIDSIGHSGGHSGAAARAEIARATKHSEDRSSRERV